MKKELGKGRDDRVSDDGRRGDPAWMMAGAEDFVDETPLLEQRRQEFEAERKAKQVRSQLVCWPLMSFCITLYVSCHRGWRARWHFKILRAR